MAASPLITIAGKAVRVAREALPSGTVRPAAEARPYGPAALVAGQPVVTAVQRSASQAEEGRLTAATSCKHATPSIGA